MPWRNIFSVNISSYVQHVQKHLKKSAHWKLILILPIHEYRPSSGQSPLLWASLCFRAWTRQIIGSHLLIWYNFEIYKISLEWSWSFSGMIGPLLLSQTFENCIEWWCSTTQSCPHKALPSMWVSDPIETPLQAAPWRVCVATPEWSWSLSQVREDGNLPGIRWSYYQFIFLRRFTFWAN